MLCHMIIVVLNELPGIALIMMLQFRATVMKVLSENLKSGSRQICSGSRAPDGANDQCLSMDVS